MQLTRRMELSVCSRGAHPQTIQTRIHTGHRDSPRAARSLSICIFYCSGRMTNLIEWRTFAIKGTTHASRRAAANPTASALAWGHADRAIQPDHFTIQHGVADDGLHEQRILRRIAEAGWKRHLPAEFLQCGFRHSFKQWCQEQTRCNGHHANGELRQIAGAIGNVIATIPPLDAEYAA